MPSTALRPLPNESDGDVFQYLAYHLEHKDERDR